MQLLTVIEILSVITGLLWIVLLIRENILCWLFGIISSALSIYLFYSTKLYSEAILYIYFVLIGIYGWYMWNKKDSAGDSLKITDYSWKSHSLVIVIGLLGTYFLGNFFSSTDAARPYHDASSTSFSFLASYLEAKKILSGWLYWICINAFSVWLYFDRDLYMYSGLMVIYFILSIYGYWNWKKKKSVV